MLSLYAIDQLWPATWRQFSPSPRVGYIEHVHRRLVTLGVIRPGDRLFQGFCNVPRYFHPTAYDEALALSLELICWYFYFDDPFDDGIVTAAERPKLISRMLRVLEEGELSEHGTPVEHLGLLFRTHALHLNGGQSRLFERFIETCSAWVRSILPINRQELRSLPTMEEYEQLRLKNVGILPEFVLNEIIQNLDLDESFLNAPEVKRLGELAALTIAYCNDIYSYERESKRQTQLNSLELRRIHQRLSLEASYEEQLVKLRALIDEFVSIEHGLTRHGTLGWSTEADSVAAARRRLQQTQYIESMKAIVVGNHYWSLADGRYYSRTSPFKELRRRHGQEGAEEAQGSPGSEDGTALPGSIHVYAGP
jgi:hypothetical protein